MVPSRILIGYSNLTVTTHQQFSPFHFFSISGLFPATWTSPRHVMVISPETHFTNRSSAFLFSITVSAQQMNSYLYKLKGTLSAGPDGFPLNLLKRKGANLPLLLCPIAICTWLVGLSLSILNVTLYSQCPNDDPSDALTIIYRSIKASRFRKCWNVLCAMPSISTSLLTNSFLLISMVFKMYA